MKFMQIKPQKARGKLVESMWNDPEWVAEEKFDGDRRIAQFCGGVVRFTGTRESVDGTGYVEKSDNIPHLKLDAGAPHRRPDKILALDGTVLDGEIVAPFAKDLPGGKSKYVTSIMGSDPEKAVWLQTQRSWLEYMVFDCLWYKGMDVRALTLGVRQTYAKSVLTQWGNPHAKLVLQVTGAGKKRFCAQIIKSGGEGVILKYLDQTYGDEKLWVKVKGEWTADVVVMGFELGKGKYRGMVGAIIFGQMRSGKLCRCGTARGFTDSLMRMMSLNPKKYMGRVLRIKHNGREPTGAFRHPRFDGWRDDKSVKDCVFDLEEK